MGVIKPAQTEWDSPIVFVPEKNGPLRFCVEYCKLEAVTIWDLYPISHMKECIDSLYDATIFSTLDASRRYFQKRWPKNVAINPPLHPIMDLSDSIEWRLGWKAPQGRLSKRWTSYSQRSNANLPLSISQCLHIFAYMGRTYLSG